ncbi:MAG: hypothetical protein ACXWLG_10725 [Myxococcaceae bacterium]
MHPRPGPPRILTGAHLAAAVILLIGCATSPAAGSAGTAGSPDGVVMPLEWAEGLQLVGGRAEPVTYQGRRAIRLDAIESVGPDDVVLAVVSGLDFQDGEIEVEVAGAPRVGAPADARGFIGVAFHRSPDGTRSEEVYLRPTNGRADDQLRRNHTVQYQSSPDYGWKRLRDESPGVYESYVDLQPGVWTRMRVKVSGTRAELYVDGAEQPCLIVRDLKLGATRGGVALWSHRTTDGHFRNLRVVPSAARP